MSPAPTVFPFPGLPAGEVTPSAGPGDDQVLLHRDIAIIRWFIERWDGRSRPESTLERLLAASDKVDMRAPVTPVDDLEREAARHGLHLTSAVLRLAWAVRALHGNGGAIDRVDASFINAELLGDDSKEADVERTLPAGVGTVVLAGRLLQAGGGRIHSINGNRGIGHDIKWVTGDGDTVYVERKDRSYEAGLLDTQDKRIRRVVEEARKAGLTMPRDRGAVRVVVVGFQHLVRKHEAKQVDKGYYEALQRELGRGRVRGEDLPHFVVVEHLGMEPKTGGDKFNFFSPQALRLKPRDLAYRVGRLLVRALGAKL